jgi:hypothetical protein
MDEFRLNKQFKILCKFQKTRNGFKHVAFVMKDSHDVLETKCCYLNRTWESYEFQSVVHQAIDRYFSDKKLAARYKKAIDKKVKDVESKRFDPVKMVCKMGEVLCNTTEEKVDWNKRMIGTIPGIDFPDEFDSLPTEEKEKRLNSALEVL